MRRRFGDESWGKFCRMARRGKLSHSDIEQFNRFVRAWRGELTLHITAARLLAIQQTASPSPNFIMNEGLLKLLLRPDEDHPEDKQVSKPDQNRCNPLVDFAWTQNSCPFDSMMVVVIHFLTTTRRIL